MLGDLAVAAFFESEKPKEREAKRSELANRSGGCAGNWYDNRLLP